MGDVLTTSSDDEFIYWVGVDRANSGGDTPDDDSVYRAVGIAEGLESATPDRLNLWQPDARGISGPRYIASFTLGGDERMMDDFVRDRLAHNWTVSSINHGGEITVLWRLLYRKIYGVGASNASTAVSQLIGMTPAADATAEQIDGFNEFYNSVHLPEVMADRGFTGASRYELVRALAYPAPPCPRYLALYDLDREGASRVSAPHPGSQVTSRPKGRRTAGPKAWEQRDTAWRLQYHVERASCRTLIRRREE